MSHAPSTAPRLEGRYVICDEIAAGGTATVHFGRLLGQGFARTVAIKRLHPTFARDPQFVGMFHDEARLAARIRHPNVCGILDVATVDGVPCLVLDYVHGEPLSKLIDALVARNDLVPFGVAAGIVCGMLHGLHAAHEAIDEQGKPLHIIHRDVSPQNVLVGNDGVPRLVDFGMAKAMGRLQNTANGQLKGKIGYMAPEQFELKELDRRVDVYSAAVVLWETLTCEFLFERTAPSTLMAAILEGNLRNPRSLVPAIPKELDRVCMRGLSRDPSARFATAREMAVAIEAALVLPTPHEIGAWASNVAGEVLRERAAVLARIESEHASSGASLFPQPSSTPAHVIAKRSSPKPTYRRTAAVALTIVAMSSLLYLLVREPTPLPSAAAQSSAAPPTSALLPVASAHEDPEASLQVEPETSEPTEPEDSPPVEPAGSAPEPALHTRPAASFKRSPPAPAPPPPPTTPHYCNPPYRVDADGIRHPKRECLSINRGR